MRLLLCLAVTRKDEDAELEIEDPVEILLADVRRPHFYALRRIFVEMPREDQNLSQCGGVAEMVMSLYSTRDEAAYWEAEYSRLLTDAGMAKGQAAPCLFYDAAAGVRVLVHGDDFVAVGRRSGLDKLQSTLEAPYEIKTERLGWSKGRQRQGIVLGHIIRLTAGVPPSRPTRRC